MRTSANSDPQRAENCKTMSSKGHLRCTKFCVSAASSITSEKKCVFEGGVGVHRLSTNFFRPNCKENTTLPEGKRWLVSLSRFNGRGPVGVSKSPLAILLFR